MSSLPGYGVIGLVVMIVSEAGMLLGREPFATWHTPFAWTGYILFADGIVRARRGHSWLTAAPAEFAFMAAASIPLWLVFEGYNLLIENWHYVGLPRNPYWRTLGYAWSFATIWPAIFETADLVAIARGRHARPSPVSRRVPLSGTRLGLVAAGALMLLWPIVWPSPYLAAPVWLGFIALLDPLNARAGCESLVGDAAAGSFERLINLSGAGVVCGVLWEFWNYWAAARWVYAVPILPDVKVFEMPILGYLGFPAFALECFTMYVFVRRWFWRRAPRTIAL